MSALRRIGFLPLLLLLFGLAGAELISPAEWLPWAGAITAIISLMMLGAGGKLPVRIIVASALVLILIAIYALNPTHDFKPGIGLIPVASIANLPGSACAAGTWEAFRIALMLCAAFALAWQLPRAQVRGLQWVAVGVALGMSLLVAAQRLEPRPWPIFEYTGIFVNENHFAVFINLLLPVILALAARSRFRALQTGAASSPAGMIFFVAALMGWAVYLSHSRAGTAILMLIFSLHLLWIWVLRRRYPFTSVMPAVWFRTGAALIVMLAAVVVGFTFFREWKHLESFLGELQYRWGIIHDTWRIWRDQPVWGIGPGTYASVWPYYASPAYDGRIILHAHVEPVQFLAEWGWAGCSILFIAFLLVLLRRPGRSANHHAVPAWNELEKNAFRLGILAIMLHGLIDFPLRIPLLALISAAWLALAFRPSTHQSS
ncbi:MAG: O-antigen ligase family protein [Kiritimatiellia bacterium]|jgi:hypothetical protein